MRNCESVRRETRRYRREMDTRPLTIEIPPSSAETRKALLGSLSPLLATVGSFLGSELERTKRNETDKHFSHKHVISRIGYEQLS